MMREIERVSKFVCQFCSKITIAEFDDHDLDEAEPTRIDCDNCKKPIGLWWPNRIEDVDWWPNKIRKV